MSLVDEVKETSSSIITEMMDRMKEVLPAGIDVEEVLGDDLVGRINDFMEEAY